MEYEIDLRPYLQALLRRWYIIAAIALGCALLAAVLTVRQPVIHQATADVLIVSSSPQLRLDERYITRDATVVTGASQQRQALIDLATSGVLERRVARELGEEDAVPGSLLAKIQVTSASDLLRVTASAQDDAPAAELAETWARTYEAMVGELYSGAESSTSLIDVQIAEARQRFDEARGNLDAFYAQGDLVAAQQQVDRLDGLLDIGVDAQLHLYTEYLTRTEELSLIIEDARSLQAQRTGGTPPDLASALSSLAVRARIAGAERLPIQLTFDSAESFAQGQAEGSDLDRFVTVLEGERDRMVAEAEALTRAMAEGDSTAVGLPVDQRARYEAELGTARGALARAQSQESLLKQQVEVALRSLEVLQARRDELLIAQTTPQVSVRLVGSGVVAPRSVASSTMVNALVGGIVGAILGMILVLAFEIISSARRRTARPASRAQGEAATDSRGVSD